MRRLLLLLVSFVVVWPLAAQQKDALRQLQKFVAAYRYLDSFYVDSTDMKGAIEGAIEGMLSTLDPHSAYVSADEMKQVEVELEGGFSGIGIQFAVQRDTVVIDAVIAGGPAERVGMLPGDRIVQIDTLRAVGFKQSDVPKYLRGKQGTKVAVDVVRRGVGDRLHFVMVRDKIPVTTVDAAYMVDPEVGYIKINRFGRTTMTEFREAWQKLRRPKKLVLDLRGNGGGLMDQAIELAGFFLPRGSLLLSTEGRAIPSSHYSAQVNGENLDGRVAVVIDDASASASEIVAGALQDWDRATIVGRTSFGKGLVQRQVPLGDGSAVRITVARYHTPSGRVIQRPYERGKRREYYLEHLRGYADSVADDAPTYRTLRLERTVYGGGGIRPDLLVESDTTGYSPYYGKLVRRGVMHEVVADYMDGEREQLTATYPTFEQFEAAFRPSDALLEQLVVKAEAAGIARNEAEFAQSRQWIERQLRALVAQRLFGVEGFYRAINPSVEAVCKAVEVVKGSDPLCENR